MATKKEDKAIEPKAVEEVKVETEVEDYTEEFIARTLKAISLMENKAKAKRLAERVLRNRSQKGE